MKSGKWNKMWKCKFRAVKFLSEGWFDKVHNLAVDIEQLIQQNNMRSAYDEYPRDARGFQ